MYKWIQVRDLYLKVTYSVTLGQKTLSYLGPAGVVASDSSTQEDEEGKYSNLCNIQ